MLLLDSDSCTGCAVNALCSGVGSRCDRTQAVSLSSCNTAAQQTSPWTQVSLHIDELRSTRSIASTTRDDRASQLSHVHCALLTSQTAAQGMPSRPAGSMHRGARPPQSLCVLAGGPAAPPGLLWTWPPRCCALLAGQRLSVSPACLASATALLLRAQAQSQAEM